MENRKNRKSIVRRLTVYYVVLTLVNLVVFYVASGSNQVRLIAERTRSIGAQMAYAIYADLKNEVDWLRHPPLVLNPTERKKIIERVLAQKTIALQNFIIYSTEPQILLSYPGESKASLLPEAELLGFKALSQRNFGMERFALRVDMLRFQMEVSIVLVGTGETGILFYTRTGLEFIRDEIMNLVRLAVAMILFLFANQLMVGWIVYRSLVMPILKIRDAANKMEGDRFPTVDYIPKHEDELAVLVQSFNSMSDRLKVNAETINRNYEELQHKDSMLSYDLEIANRIQEALQPKKLSNPLFEVQISFKPLASVSGDYYDFIECADGSIVVFLGDVSGHGVPAAFLTIMAKVYLSDLVPRMKDPAELLKELNRLLSHYFEGDGLYLTAFCIRIYPDLRAEYCNCMHPDPMVFSRKTGSVLELESKGFLIGIMEEPPVPFVTQKLSFAEGDLLILYTDGLTEARIPDSLSMYGFKRLRQEVERLAKYPLRELHEGLLKSVNEFSMHHGFNDDLTLICVQFKDGSVTLEGATSKYYAGEYSNALNELEQLAQMFPQDALRIQYLRSLCYLRLRNFSSAFSLLQQITDHEKQETNLSLKAGLASMKARQHDAAGAHLQQIIEREPGHATAWALLALNHYRSNRQEDALSALIAAEKLAPNARVVSKVRKYIIEGEN